MKNASAPFHSLAIIRTCDVSMTCDAGQVEAASRERSQSPVRRGRRPQILHYLELSDLRRVHLDR